MEEYYYVIGIVIFFFIITSTFRSRNYKSRRRNFNRRNKQPNYSGTDHKSRNIYYQSQGNYHIKKKRYYKSANIDRRTIINTHKALKNHQLQNYIIDIAKIRGDEGERQLKEFIISNKNFTKSPIFSSKRIFDQYKNHKREIDIIVVTKKLIYIIECKNWSGEITSFNMKDNYLNYKSYYNGSIEQRFNPIIDNNYKLNLLHSILNDKFGNIPVEHFVNKLIFINKEMKYPISIEKNENVITYRQLSRYFSSQETGHAFSLSKALVSGLLHLIKSEEQVNDTLQARYGDLPHYKKIVQYLDSLPTWDYITLSDASGTKNIISGDIRISNLFYNKQLNYRDISTLKVVPGKSFLIPLIFCKSNLNASIIWKNNSSHNPKTVPINYEGKIYFREAGSPDQTEYNILDIDSITIGSFNSEPDQKNRAVSNR
ncbi:MAG: NERD domain-containing protein [Deltaproteobacteria bacterium]|jgi:hypothetical protein|nr:NERD domain-containing protein [Deltaproteobacteria bacterium]